MTFFSMTMLTIITTMVSGTGLAIIEDPGLRQICEEYRPVYVNTGLRKYENSVNIPGEIIESIRIISKENTSEPKSHMKDMIAGETKVKNMIAENMMAKEMIAKDKREQNRLGISIGNPMMTLY